MRPLPAPAIKTAYKKIARQRAFLGQCKLVLFLLPHQRCGRQRAPKTLANNLRDDRSAVTAVAAAVFLQDAS